MPPLRACYFFGHFGPPPGLLCRHKGKKLSPKELEEAQAEHCKYLRKRTSVLMSASADVLASYWSRVLLLAELRPEASALDLMSEVSAEKPLTLTVRRGAPRYASAMKRFSLKRFSRFRFASSLFR